MSDIISIDKPRCKPRTKLGPAVHNRYNVLTPEAYELVLQLHAAGWKTCHIAAELEKRGLKRPSAVRLAEIPRQPCNQKKVELYRKKYLNNLEDVPTTFKKVRAQMLDDVINKINNTLEKLTDRKDVIKSKQFKKFLALAKRLNELIVSVREEMERRPQFQLVQIQNAEYTMDELLGELRDHDNRIVFLQSRGVTLPFGEKTPDTGGDTLPG